MGASSKKNRKSGKKKAKKGKSSIRDVPMKRFSPLGWMVLLAPLSIVVFLLLFGNSIPFLVEQSSREAENNADTVCRFGKEEMKAGHYQGAYAYFIKALKIKPDYAEAHINLSQLFYLNGDIPKAIEWLHKAITFNPPQKDLIFNNLGLLYAQSGEFQTALNMFEQALSTGMKSEQVYNNIGTVNISLGNYVRAVEAYQAAIEHRPTVRSMYIEMLRKVAGECYDDEEQLYMYNAANEHLERGITDEELAVYDSVSVFRFARTEIRQAELYKNLSRALELNGELKEAIRYCEKALKLDANSPLIHYQLGNLYLKQMKLNQAHRHLQMAIRLNPRLNDARIALENVNRLIEKSK